MVVMHYERLHHMERIHHRLAGARPAERFFGLLTPQNDRAFPQSASFWETVDFKSGSTCGLAFSTGARVVVPDIETCDFMAGTRDLDEYRRSNIRAVQSTPFRRLQ